MNANKLKWAFALVSCVTLTGAGPAGAGSVGAAPQPRVSVVSPGELLDLKRASRAVDKAGNWRVGELRNIKALMKRHPNAKVRIVVVSPEELARLGLSARGRIIYRYIEGRIEVIITSPTGDAGRAAALAEQVAQGLSQPVNPAKLIPGDAPQGTPNSTNPTRPVWPGTRSQSLMPRDFLENPSRQNVSPS